MFQKLRLFSNRCPIIFAFAVMIIGTVLTEIPAENWLMNTMDYQSASYITGVVSQGLVSVLLVVLLSKMGLLQAAGFTRPSQWKQLWLLWPLLALSVVNGLDVFTGALVIDGSKQTAIILYTLLYISVGFVEEILFRGVMMTIMVQKWGTTRKGIYKAVIVSSVLFGLLHLVNLAMGRYSLLAAATQTGYALFFGVFFGACMLRNNSIWPVIFGHTVFDFFGALNAISVGGTFTRSRETTPQNALVSILFTLPLLIFGLIYLRKVKTIEVKNNYPD